MNRCTLSALAVVAVLGLYTARGQAADQRAELLSEPAWLLRSGSEQTMVWFEAGRNGTLELVKCQREQRCRVPVSFDDGGFHVGGPTGVNFPLELAARNVPIFASPAGTLLMPMWVVPTSQSRLGF